MGKHISLYCYVLLRSRFRNACRAEKPFRSTASAEKEVTLLKSSRNGDDTHLIHTLSKL
jgi:hypothetical protein